MPLGLAPLFVQAQTFSATGGDRLIFDIPNDYPLSAFQLRASGNIVVGTADADGLRSGGASNVIRNVRIQSKGEQRLDLAGRKFRLNHQLMNQGSIVELQPGLTVGTRPFVSNISRQFQMPRFVIPINDKGILPVHLLRDIQVVVDIAPPSEVLEPAATTTLAYTEGSVAFTVIQAPAASGLGPDYFVNEQLVDLIGENTSVMASTGERDIDLNVGGKYRYLALMVEDLSGTGGNRVFRNDLITQIVLKSNRTEMFRGDWSSVQADNGLDFLLPNANPPLDGIAVIDFTRFSTPQELLDADALQANNSDLTLTVTVAATGTSASLSVIGSRIFGLNVQG